MPDEELRSGAARRTAERALVRVVHHYGARPEFVVLGGLVPELLTDLDNEPANAEIRFVGCEQLGAANLRGTGFASRDVEVHELNARIGGVEHRVEVNITGLAGFLLAKTAAAASRRKPKDWYDVVFVLMHNDAGGPVEAASIVSDRFKDDLAGMRMSIDDLRANFADPSAQGPTAYAEQMLIDHPDLDMATLRADAVVAVGTFYEGLFKY